VGATLIDWLRPGKSLKGKLVVVTGAASGLGRETAFELARQGARLALWDINREQMEATTKEVTATGAEARCYSCDISQYDPIDCLLLAVGASVEWP
jgi:NAD(P)-dependent dehydrogenase (short-subunit alcohol dehydrogenase family)